MGRDIPFPWLRERERSSLVSAQPLLMVGAGKTPSTAFGGLATSAGAWRLCLLLISSLCSCSSPCPPSLSPPLSPPERPIPLRALSGASVLAQAPLPPL